MDVNGLISAASQLFNEKKYAEAIEKLHQAWDGITDKSTQIREQIGIQSGFGFCYFEQAMKAKDTDEADKLFGKAVEHYQEWLRFAKQLANEQNNIQGQINVQSWLGRCYYEQAIKTKDTDKADELFGKAVKHYKEWLRLAKTDGQNSIQQQINAQSWLGHCYFERIKRIKSTPEAEKFVTQASKYFSAAFRQMAQINDEREQEKLKKGIHPYLRDID